MIGQLIDRRYRIVKIIGSNPFGQTYVAADTRRPGYPQCVVRELRLPSKISQTPPLLKAIFQRKAEMIEKLGKHERIPELLAYFEENQNLYLVEEFIVGEDLTQELVVGKGCSEEQAIELLEEILQILVFIHENGVIHRNIQPAHLIRRSLDGKLVLIDFGLSKEMGDPALNSQLRLAHSLQGDLKKGTNTINESLYVPIEQSQGNPRFNSDLYATGLIVIQALTGLSPQELAVLKATASETGDIVWRDRATCSVELADIIDKMVHYDFEDRYQSASEVLAALKAMVNSSKNVTENAPIPETIATPALVGKQLPSKAIWFSVGVGAVLLVAAGLWYFWYRQEVPMQVKLLFERAAEKVKQGDQAGAIADYTQAIELNTRDPEGYYKRANTKYDLGSYQEAIQDYTQALQVNSNHTKSYYNRGLAYYDSGDPRAAMEDFSQVIRLNPNDADAYYQRGLTYYDLGDYRSAIEDYNQVLRINPNDAKAYSNRGLARSAAGDKQGAMADYTQALTLNPNEPSVYYSRGRARFNLADYKGAVEDYTKAIQFNPNLANAYTNRCSAYVNLAAYDQAIEDCSQAIRLDPKDWAAYNNRCIAHISLKLYQKAAEDCGQTIGMNANNPKAYSNRGMARFATGDKQGAVADFTEAIRLNPSDAVAYSNRGSTYSDLGNLTGAIQDYAQAIRLNPSNATAYFNRGAVRRQLKDKPGALEDFQKAATLFLEQGRADEYKKAQEQINQLQ
ncbi:MAG: tetratricopeptide repeat protein [Actinomycetota bacterium]